MTLMLKSALKMKSKILQVLIQTPKDPASLFAYFISFMSCVIPPEHAEIVHCLVLVTRMGSGVTIVFTERFKSVTTNDYNSLIYTLYK
jgi:hypothetical protein